MRNSIKAVIENLKKILSQVEKYQLLAGDEERAERLEAEAEAITEALALLEEIE